MRAGYWCGRSTRFLVWFVAGLIACDEVDRGSDGGRGPDARPGSRATALFELPRGATPPSEFYALPFPNDVRRRADGTIDLADHTRPGGLVDTYLDIFSRSIPGFGTNSAVFFRFSGGIEAGSLPATPEESREQDASVYLVDVTPGAPHDRWPLRYRFEPRRGSTIGPNWLSVLPYPGFPLRGGHTYAAVVTTRLRADGGGPVEPDTDFVAIRTSAAPADDAEVTRARMLYAPLLDWLDEPGGDDRASVVSAAVFTTQDPTGLMEKVHTVARAAPQPTVVEGSVGVADSHPTYTLYTGDYQNHPNFQSGTVPYQTEGGEILVDEAGIPIIQRFETLRFAVSIPTGPQPDAGWPVVVYAHGTGGDYRSFDRDGTSTNLALEGLAVISIDNVLHGPRDPTHSDPDLTFFNFMNPVAARDNVRQGAADDFTVIRLLETLTVAGNAFDSERIFYFGHSQGGLTGPLTLAFEPDVRGAVLSGAGGLLYFSLINKTEPFDVAALVTLLLNETSVDEFNNVLALVQMFIEGGDPVNYAPLLTQNIFQSEGMDDHFAPPPDIDALAVAMGNQPVTPVLSAVKGLSLRDLDVVDPPLTHNTGGVTKVLLQYEPPALQDGHFVIFDVPAALTQSRRFLGTLATSGSATLVAP